MYIFKRQTRGCSEERTHTKNCEPTHQNREKYFKHAGLFTGHVDVGNDLFCFVFFSSSGQWYFHVSTAQSLTRRPLEVVW